MVEGKKELEITVLPDGRVRVETNGVKGQSCEDVVKFLEETLGKPEKKKRKPEYYEREASITDSVTRKSGQP